MAIGSAEFKRDLAAVLNKHSVDSKANTPDHLLAAHIECMLEDLALLQAQVKAWHEETAGSRYRDAGSGYYVTEEYALAHPDTTVKEQG